MRRWVEWRWPTRGEWLLVGVILLVFVLDVVQQSVVLVPFFFVPLVAAAAVEGPRVTAALSVMAMALVLVSGVYNGYVLGVDFWVRLTAMTMFAVLAVALSALIDRRQRLLRQFGDQERRDRQRLAAVFEFSPTPAVRLSAGRPGQTRVLAVNDAMKQLMGVDLTGAAAAGMQALIVAEDRDIAESVLAAAAASAVGPASVAEQREVRLRPVSGGLRSLLMSACAVGEADVDGYRELVLQFEDITARREAEQALTVKALTDEVTGLPNRYALTDRLARALARLSRQPGLVCVLFCDLDQFKQVNDRYGHQVGDLLLQEVALRLKAGVRPDDTVARLGGDEFIVVYEGITAPSDAILMALRLQDRVRQQWVHDGVDFHPTVSVGVVATADPNASIDDLLRRADIAMYRAKDTGRDRVELYDRSLDGELAQAVAMQQQLRQALREDGLVLRYQPVVTLTDGSITGAEALLRMRGPDGTLVGPDRFLPHAEASGLIAPVGAWVLQRALADIRGWHRQGLHYLVSVNVSPTELRRPGFATLVREQIEDAQVDPTWLSLEVTETALVRDRDTVTDTLRELHDMGVGIALDDFGTGYSSLSWLNDFPVDTIKIDISFVRELGSNPRRTAIVAALLQIATQLKLNVIAEGIETPRQRDMLTAMGCPQGQGYLLGRPVPCSDPIWAPPQQDAQE